MKKPGIKTHKNTNMSHKTKKKEKHKEKNNLKRVSIGFNTGTRDMGYESNQQRKEQAIIDSLKKEDSDSND